MMVYWGVYDFVEFEGNEVYIVVIFNKIYV